jgi:hypothetical protein
VHPLRGGCVAQRERTVHDVDQALQQQAGDDQVDQSGDGDPADRVRRAPADPAVQQPGEPAVHAANAAPDRHEEGEDQHSDERRGNNEQDVVVRYPHQLADLVLPVLPEPEDDGVEHAARDEEGQPGPVSRAPGIAVGEGTPDPRGDDAQPVTDGRGDAEDDPLNQAAAREQRRREGKTAEDEGAPAAGQRHVQQPALGRLLLPSGGLRGW